MATSAQASVRQALPSGGVNGNGNELAGEESTPYKLACDYINYRLGKEGCYWGDRPSLSIDFDHPTRLFQAMRLVGDEFERRYRDVFDDMCETLQITAHSAYSTFKSICEELFRDGIRWGRIVALFTFGGALALDCHRRQMPQLVGCVADWVATYVETHLDDWISENGGWDGFLQFYENRPAADQEHAQPIMRRVMAGVGVACGALGVVTLGAILAARS